MLGFVKKLFGKTDPEKRIAFIDGDQDVKRNIEVYDQFIKGTDTEAHFVRMGTIPKLVKRSLANGRDFNVVLLEGFASGKETVDKFIGAYILKAVKEGYTDISVVSNDYDFLEIFRMAIMIDESSENVNFTLFMPNAAKNAKRGKVSVKNIKIVKCNA